MTRLGRRDSRWRKTSRALAVVGSLLIVSAARALVPSDALLISTQRIWDNAPHNAFTDLELLNGQFYCTFREATQHGVPPAGTQGGRIRVLRSSTGSSWGSVGLMDFGIDNDLRDPKLSVTPDNRLLLIASDSPQNGGTRQSYAWTLTNTTWSVPTPTVDAGRWLWRVEWNGATGYGISYLNNSTRLHKTNDGLHYTNVVNTLTTGNEAALLFRQNGSAIALVRRDPANAVIGTSTGDYTSWTWHDAGRFVGGPSMIELPDGRIVVGGRLTDGTTRTSLMFLNPSTGSLNEFLALPSGGDTSYPGFVWKDQTLWVSYYSSHEGKASIYLSQVKFAGVPEPAPGMLILPASAGLLLFRRPDWSHKS